MTVNEFAQDVHKNAVAHGWYDAPITFPEVAVMIHAEISEAVEEWRSGNPVIYGTCALSPENCKFSKICDNVGHPSGADTEGNCKPEGVAVELCDAVMRIMDFLAFMGVDIEAVLNRESPIRRLWQSGTFAVQRQGIQGRAGIHGRARILHAGML